MAVRQAIRRYPDLGSFVAEYESTLRVGALMLPADALGGQEPAPELKLDLHLPIVGRVGPVAAQVVARMPDGSVALRLPEMPPSVEAGIKKVFDAIAEVRAYLLASGEVVSREERDALRALLASLSSGEDEGGEEAPGEETEQAEQAEQGWAEPAPQEGGDEELIDDEAPPSGESAPQAQRWAPPEVEELVDDEPTPSAPAMPSAPAAPIREGPLGMQPGLPLPDLSARAPNIKGDVRENGLRNQMIALQLSRESGLLRVVTPDGTERYGYWRDGGPVGFCADPPVEDEWLGALLERSGQLSPQRREASLALMHEEGLRQGEALVRMGALREEHLAPVLARQVEFILGRLLALKGGTWGFFRLSELPDGLLPPPTSVVALLYRAYVGHARKIPPRDMVNLLRKRWDQGVRLIDAAIPALREVRYTREEAVVFDAIRARARPVRDLMGGAAGPAEQVGPVLWTLGELGLLEYVRGESSEARDARSRELIQARLESTREATHFEALDLHWICLGEDVARNNRRLREELGLTNVEAMPDETRKLASQLVTRLDEAMRHLGDDARRRAYRATLIGPADLRRCAELLVQEGEALLAESAAERARACFARALELDPAMPEARAGLQRAS